MKRLNWLACISQTGRELMEICLKNKILPRYVLTNNRFKIDSTVFDFLIEHCISIIPTTFNDIDYDHLESLKFDLITLHGFLKIIPSDFCNSQFIINGHPGLITRYPELKGKDPQIRGYEGQYPYIGSVIHKVIPEVDAGEVLYQVEVKRDFEWTLADFYMELRKASFQTWEMFFKDYA